MSRRTDGLRASPPVGKRVPSEGALQETVAAAAGGTLVLPPEPVHHMTGVSSVSTAQTEVGRTADGHVTDGTLKGETLADGALRPTSLTAAVTAVHAELCKETTGHLVSEDTIHIFMTSDRDGQEGRTDAFVRLRRTGGELEDVGSFVPQTPAV